MVRAAAKNFASVGRGGRSGALRRDRRRAPPRGRPDARDASRARRPRRSRTPPPTTRPSPDGSREQDADAIAAGVRRAGVREGRRPPLRREPAPARRAVRGGRRAGRARRREACLQGKEMSFNNWLDVDAAYALASALPAERGGDRQAQQPVRCGVGGHACRGVREGVRVRHGVGVRRDRGVPRRRATRTPPRRWPTCSRRSSSRRRSPTARWRRSPSDRTSAWCRRRSRPAAGWTCGRSRGARSCRTATLGRPRRREDWKVVSSREPTDAGVGATSRSRGRWRGA